MLDAALQARLDHLHALATHPQTPQAEVEAALAGIQRILTKHNIDNFTPTSSHPKPVITREYVRMPNRSLWRSDLLCGLAKLNMCFPLYSTNYGKPPDVIIIGHEPHIAQARETWTVYCGVIDRVSLETEVPQWENTKSWRNNFRVGMVSGLMKRLREEAAAAKAEVTDGNALVLVIEQDVRNRVKELYPRLSNRTNNRNIGSGWQAGFAAGQQARAHKELQ